MAEKEVGKLISRRDVYNGWTWPKIVELLLFGVELDPGGFPHLKRIYDDATPLSSPRDIPSVAT
jgi:hypothetical protein